MLTWYYKYILGADALLLIQDGTVTVGFGQFSLSFINDCKAIVKDTQLLYGKIYMKKEDGRAKLFFSKEVLPQQQQRFRNAYFF